jgi:hypothetical protein
MLAQNRSVTHNGVTATFTHISGQWGTHSGTCHFTCLHNEILDMSTLKTLQERLGRHPCGYGFYGLTITETAAGFLHTWTSSDNCD